jgi:hypothetical protein
MPVVRQSYSHVSAEPPVDVSRAYVLAPALALLLLTLNVGPAQGQQGPWTVGAGLGGAPNPHRQKGSTAVSGELGRRVLGGPDAGIGAAVIGGFFLPQTDYACSLGTADEPCDRRVFSRFMAVSASVGASLSRGEWSYYARVGGGPWWGSDVDASGGQSTAERGGLVTLEVGSRSGRVTVGIEQKRLEGTRFGMIPLMNVVVRFSL